MKNYYWLLPLAGGIISIIGFFIPAWYSPLAFEEYLWITGIIHHVLPSGDVFEILPPELFIPSLITTILISLSLFMIIINYFFKFRSKTLLGNTEKLWIIIIFLGNIRHLIRGYRTIH